VTLTSLACWSPAHETPLYCLLEDDKLISQLKLQTDLLLEPVETGKPVDKNDVRLLLTVNLRPADPLWGAVTFFAS
jgi:hypothetical protein